MQERRAERTNAYSATEAALRICNQLDNIKATVRALAQIAENQAERINGLEQSIIEGHKKCSS